VKPRTFLDVTRGPAGRAAISAATEERAARVQMLVGPPVKVGTIEILPEPIIPRPCVPVHRHSRITTWPSACMGDGVIYFGTGWELVPC
jgi:hypothetical protein